jgi:predicted RNA binding protein YcfA (HicA-like mRNA interferase family)
MKHPTKPGTVTVAGELGIDVPPGTLANIWRQAGLWEDR